MLSNHLPMKNPFIPLQNKVFRRLYLSQTISLLGDAFTWVGIALLAYQFGGNHSAAILATALTLRVSAFIFFGPYAGVLADRIDRKKILYRQYHIYTHYRHGMLFHKVNSKPVGQLKFFIQRHFVSRCSLCMGNACRRKYE